MHKTLQINGVSQDKPLEKQKKKHFNWCEMHFPNQVSVSNNEKQSGGKKLIPYRESEQQKAGWWTLLITVMAPSKIDDTLSNSKSHGKCDSEIWLSDNFPKLYLIYTFCTVMNTCTTFSAWKLYNCFLFLERDDPPFDPKFLLIAVGLNCALKHIESQTNSSSAGNRSLCQANDFSPPNHTTQCKRIQNVEAMQKYDSSPYTVDTLTSYH